MKQLLMYAICIASLACGQAHAVETCAWFRAEVVPGDWWIVHGKCEITVTGEKFVALLYDGDNPKFLRVKVTGTIDDTKVHAAVETEASDAGVVTLQGTLTKGDIYKNVILLGSGYDTVGIKFGPN